MKVHLRPALILGLATLAVLLLTISWSNRRAQRLQDFAFANSWDGVRFIVFGDFGAGQVGGKDHHQEDVAHLLSSVAAHFQPQFIATTGDIIYDDGIQSIADMQLKTKHRDLYSANSLQVPWHIIPGNHDCHGSLDAMVEYAQLPGNHWDMPARYYVKTISFGDKSARLIYLEFQLMHHMFWHIAVSMTMPHRPDTCLLVCGQMRNFRCEDSMRASVNASLRQDELAWLRKELTVPAQWKLVFGHWGIFSHFGNGPTQELVDDLLPLLREFDVDVYFNGHDHSLQHMVLATANTSNLAEARPHFIISGAGGYELQPELKPEAQKQLNVGSNLVYGAATPGFVQAVLTAERLRLRFVGMGDRTLHTVTLQARHPKQGELR
ncbi:uncharacterized protein MONBRDRAFT_27973 [Monosiga brevicollis MX1]|uniref:acid phosphatase n=1 Tax=Monosiga brevicollis TaxID=81824 RepID=A9V6U6_MONBE|nr:uncharacterized protein MONBRDRAFT_27973 [Monosiga brevicollis MX1]EDQ86606.1 predicted protein [Monosiga brevicollis MX1]|eukprot:XP_001748442.1 hypothetical protein [Monosiga brevicollis MX1]